MTSSGSSPTTTWGAIRLARSREQHDLALALNLLLEAHGQSMGSADDQLRMSSATFTRTLPGSLPAQLGGPDAG